jgi:hypothetical protein
MIKLPLLSIYLYFLVIIKFFFEARYWRFINKLDTLEIR